MEIALIYAMAAFVYTLFISCMETIESKKRKRRFPKYKALYKVNYLKISANGVIFPIDIVRRLIAFKEDK